jgi:hypothetical protein
MVARGKPRRCIMKSRFFAKLNEMFGENEGLAPFTKKYYFEYEKLD